MTRKLFFGICLFVCFSFSFTNDERLIGTWKLVEFEESGSIEKVETPIKLVFAQEGKLGKFTGNTARNLFSGLFDIKKKKEINIKGFMSTKLQEDDMQSERFLRKLSGMSNYKLDNNTLTLKTADNNTALKFKKEAN